MRLGRPGAPASQGRPLLEVDVPAAGATGDGRAAEHPSAGAAFRSGWGALLVTVLSRAVLSLLSGLLLWSVVPVLAGWESSVVMSGSMEPRISAGDVVLVRPAEVRDLTPGLVLLADDPDHPGRLRLHRLAEVDADTGALTLQGDANPEPDSTPVQPEAVHGIATLLVPRLGHPSVWLAEDRTWPLVATGIVLVAATAGAMAFTPERSAARRPPRHRADGRRRTAARRSTRTAVLSGLVVGVLTGLDSAAPAAYAAYVSTTSNGVNSLTSATFYSCNNAVVASSATRYYKLNEATGTTATDSSGSGAHGTYRGGVTYGVSGPCPVDGARAVTLNGTDGYVSTGASVNNPTVFTMQIWFRTVTTRGGMLMNLANTTSGASSVNAANPAADRGLFMSNSGTLHFTIGAGANTRTIGTTAAYNNGAWHLATVTLSGAGAQLYVDGVHRAGNPTATTPGDYTGYWRIGYDTVPASWDSANQPTSAHFGGSVAHASVLSVALTASQVADHYDAGR